MFILWKEPLTKTVFLMLFSLTAAAFDLKTRTVPVWLFFTAFGAGVILCTGTGRSPASVLPALLPGLLLFLMNRSTGRIGGGDVAFVICLALFLTLKEILLLVSLAFFFAALVSLAILAAAGIRGRSARGKKLPFLCFFPPGVLLWIISVYGPA